MLRSKMYEKNKKIQIRIKLYIKIHISKYIA